ncbi:glycosyltransferase family 4 protein [Rheinheimera baltica]|uniref:Glycosyltransferase family 4 protein n=1 Tax=Rheinheimera baltica TaxID=67576 RepID=A0ABT9I2A4_9GAMM|nr:glycosyltransferase family 4 protein [Rheinheimera baltica]MDP5137510.1 glycosyltransferase family 4 protein [Rheinheimera baltica]
MSVLNPGYMDKDVVEASGLFDANFYLAKYPDIGSSGTDALTHYMAFGRVENRDPSAMFSSSGYCYRYPDVKLSGCHPLIHYLALGQHCDWSGVPHIRGYRQFLAIRKTIMICGHAASDQLYGAELSLLDIAAALCNSGLNVVLTLPEALNEGYIEKLKQFCSDIHIVPQIWWRYGRAEQQGITAQFTRLLKQYNVSLLHANTIVHFEPLIAARLAAIPVVIHARELPALDPALCDVFGASPEQTRTYVNSMADLVISNSRFTADFYQAASCHVVYNSVKFVSVLPERSGKSALTVAMISSNLPKKGLDDFCQLLQMATLDRALRFKLIGPENEHTARIAEKCGGKWPENLELIGYVANIQDALADVDVVVNMSNFQESFGRTVAEAMASGKVVIAYRWGALTELIVHNVDGFLVPFADVKSIALTLNHLQQNPARVEAIGQHALSSAKQKFDLKSVSEHLLLAYTELWSE